MARYRYRRGWGKRRYKKYFKRYFRRYSRKFVNGSSRSTVRVKCAVEDNFTLSSGTTAGPGAVKHICPLLDSSNPGSALTSPLYRTYCNLYEECKVVGFKTQVSIASAIGGSDLPSLQIFTAIDRKRGATESDYTADEIKQSSTYIVATALNNNVAKITRSCYASDLMEKATWHDCSLYDNSGTYYDRAYTQAAGNPNFFIPCLYMCFQAPTLGEAVDVKVNVSTVYYFAFRNPKYGATAGSAKGIEDMGGVIRQREADMGGDMMADGDVIAAPAAKKRAVVVQPLSQQKN